MSKKKSSQIDHSTQWSISLFDMNLWHNFIHFICYILPFYFFWKGLIIPYTIQPNPVWRVFCLIQTFQFSAHFYHVCQTWAKTGSDWHQMGESDTFFYISFSIRFGWPMLKKSQICPTWCLSGPICSLIWHTCYLPTRLSDWLPVKQKLTPKDAFIRHILNFLPFTSANIQWSIDL